MKKAVLFPVLLGAGCLVAGLYGALHNQISYSVAPDYFHAFKFDQFLIPEDYHNRWGAAIVGWLASWWMGIVIGVPVLLIGLIMPDAKTYITRCLTAIAVVAVTAFLVGLGALIYASLTISTENLPDYVYPKGVTDQVAFARAATMHDFSYAGGLLGILTAGVYLVVERIRLGRSNGKLAATSAFSKA